MANDPDNDRDWQAMLYRLTEKFDVRYVLTGGEYGLIKLLVFSVVGLILTIFFGGLAAVAFGKLHLAV